MIFLFSLTSCRATFGNRRTCRIATVAGIVAVVVSSIVLALHQWTTVPDRAEQELLARGWEFQRYRVFEPSPLVTIFDGWNAIVPRFVGIDTYELEWPLRVTEAARADLSSSSRRGRVADAGPELARLAGIRRLFVGRSDADDQFLSHIAKLKQLETLSLEDTLVTKSGVACLKGLSDLNDLDLSATLIDDEVAIVLRELPSLESLDLCDTRFGDRGAAILAAHQRIEYLYLCRTRLTRAGLFALLKMKSLQHLLVCETQIADQDISDAIASRPDIEIVN